WSVVPFNAANHTFNFGHTYSSRGSYTIQVLVTDETGVSGSYSQTVNIATAPNVWWNQAPSAAVPGEPLTYTGSINDPDSTSWTARVNFNDGTGWHPLTINPDRTFSCNVTYTTNGTPMVQVEATDDTGLVGSNFKSVDLTSSVIDAPDPLRPGYSVLYV